MPESKQNELNEQRMRISRLHASGAMEWWLQLSHKPYVLESEHNQNGLSLHLEMYEGP